MWYKILLKDSDGFTIGSEHEANGMKAAKQTAKRLLSADYAKSCETTHEALRTEKVEILNESGECVADLFLN